MFPDPHSKDRTMQDHCQGTPTQTQRHTQPTNLRRSPIKKKTMGTFRDASSKQSHKEALSELPDDSKKKKKKPLLQPPSSNLSRTTADTSSQLHRLPTYHNRVAGKHDVRDSHASHFHGGSQRHRPASTWAQNGTAGSLVAVVTMGHAAGGQKNVALSRPGQQG